VGEVTQVLKPARADHQQTDHQQHHVSTAVIAARMLTQGTSNPWIQPNELKVAAHQFQTTVGSELLVTELDRKLVLDHPATTAAPSTASLGPFVSSRVASLPHSK
jgi:hypothetical protein